MRIIKIRRNHTGTHTHIHTMLTYQYLWAYAYTGRKSELIKKIMKFLEKYKKICTLEVVGQNLWSIFIKLTRVSNRTEIGMI